MPITLNCVQDAQLRAGEWETLRMTAQLQSRMLVAAASSPNHPVPVTALWPAQLPFLTRKLGTGLSTLMKDSPSPLGYSVIKSSFLLSGC